MTDTKTLLQEDDYYKPIKVGNFWKKTIIQSMKVTVIKMKTYQ